jgi:hypothetical protein
MVDVINTDLTFARREIRASEQRTAEACMAAVGETLVALEKKLRAKFETKLDSEVLKLRNEFLRDRRDSERGDCSRNQIDAAGGNSDVVNALKSSSWHCAQVQIQIGAFSRKSNRC